MSATVSLGKAAALASTALLMGGYIWFQAKNASPNVAADTTTGQVVGKPVGAQPASLPGSKNAPVEFIEIPGIPKDPNGAVSNIQTATPQVLPGSKSGAVILPGPKSDTIDLSELFKNPNKVLPGSKDAPIFPVQPLAILPGSKSGSVNLRIKPKKNPTPPAFLPGSKSMPLILPTPGKSKSPPKLPPTDNAANQPAPRPPSILPGSKTLTPLFKIPAKGTKPSARQPSTTMPPKTKPSPRKPAVLPGSKSFIVPVFPQPKGQKKGTVPAGTTTGKPNPANPPAADQPQPPLRRQPALLPPSKSISGIIEIDPKEIEKLLEQFGKTENDKITDDAKPAQKQK